eukprot:447123_1
MSSSDALSFSTSVKSIESSSKSQILSCMQSLSEQDLKNMVLSMIFRKNTQFTSMIDDDTHSKMQQDTNKSIDYIQNYFIQNNFHNINNESGINSDVNSASKLIRLPSYVCAHIISFSPMYDRIKYKLLCKDFYKICQMPISREHLIIDFKFVKAICDSTIDYRKYFNAKCLDLKFIFTTTNQSKSRYGDFETKYYFILSQIISKSPRLHSLKYDSDWYGTLNKTSVKNKYYRQHRYLHQFVSKMERILEKPFAS